MKLFTIRSLFIFSFIVLTAFVSTTPGNQWQKYNIQGKVKELRSTTYQVVDSLGTIIKVARKTRTPQLLDSAYIFDEAGYLTKKAFFNSDGDIKIIEIISYNESGKIKVKEQLSVYGNEFSLPKNKTEYFYKDNGQVRKLHAIPGNGREYNHYFMYDELGKKIKSTIDEEEVIITVGGNSNSDFTFYYKYNNYGDLIEESCYDKHNELVHKYTFSYNIQKNIIEETTQKKNISPERITYEYNSEGQKIKEENYVSFGLRSVVKFKYDTRGSVIEEATYYNNGNLLKMLKFEYEYDAIGNWIRVLEFENGIPSIMVEREIKYFDN